MSVQHFTAVLTAVNLVLLSLTLPRVLSSSAQSAGPVLRGRALELVDDRGTLRTRLNVEPGGQVVLRLLDQNGTIRVKLGAGTDGSGLVLTDENTEPGIHLIARRTAGATRQVTTSLTLKAGNQIRVIRP
jgi:hypothetical protein